MTFTCYDPRKGNSISKKRTRILLICLICGLATVLAALLVFCAVIQFLFEIAQVALDGVIRLCVDGNIFLMDIQIANLVEWNPHPFSICFQVQTPFFLLSLFQCPFFNFCKRSISTNKPKYPLQNKSYVTPSLSRFRQKYDPT